jgi:hypothetical protein
MKIKEFAKLLTDEYGKGVWRRTLVLPANKNPEGRKRPFGEDSSMSQEAVAKEPMAKINTKEMVLGDKVTPVDSHDCEPSHSLYLKHMPDMYCVDFDVKEFVDSGFYDYLMERDIYRCETTKGYHFYIKVPDIEPFTNEVKVGSGGDDIDFIKRKRNIWETDTRVIEGSGFGHLMWDDIRKFFDEPTMNFGAMVPAMVKAESVGKLSAPDDEPDEFVIVESQTCDEESMRMYLSRLALRRCENYDSWIDIGMAVKNNFKDDELTTGYELWHEWSKKSPNYAGEEGTKNKWKSLQKSDIEDRRPITYLTLKMWADKDDPQNELETIYKEKGEDAMVRHMNASVIFREQFSDYIHIFNMEDRNYEVKDKPKMKNSFDTLEFRVKVGDKEVLKNPFDIWCKNRFRASVHKIDFDPKGEMPNIFNLWNGYAIPEGIQNGDAQPLCDHIRRVWCKNNDKHYEYVMNWFAWVLQKPERKVGVMMCIRSRQGTGKGIVLAVLDAIMNGSRQNGPFAQMSNVDSILGAWTYGIEGRCLINFDEAYWGGNKKLEGQVKNLITEINQEIRKKHQSPYFIRNTTAFITTTNSHLFAGMTADDRRNFCLEADSDYVDALDDKIGYFETITKTEHGEPPCQSVVDDFAHRLYSRDLSDFKPQKFEKTDLAQEQIQQGWNSVVKWWYKVLETLVVEEESTWSGCVWADLPGETTDGMRQIQKDWWYKRYEATKVAGYSSYHESYSNFCRITKGLFSEKILVPKRVLIGGGRIQVWMVPADIEVMRQEFNRTQKFEIF